MRTPRLAALVLATLAVTPACVLDEADEPQEYEFANASDDKADGAQRVSATFGPDKRQVTVKFTCDEVFARDLCDLSLSIPTFTASGGLDGQPSGPVVLLDVTLRLEDGGRRTGFLLATWDAEAGSLSGQPIADFEDVPHGVHRIDFALRDVTEASVSLRAVWD